MGSSVDRARAPRRTAVAASADLRRCQRAGGSRRPHARTARLGCALRPRRGRACGARPICGTTVLPSQLRRTLITLDRDYLDDRRFPPGEGSGVVVIQAPNERELSKLLTRIDRVLFKGARCPEEAGSPRPPSRSTARSSRSIRSGDGTVQSDCAVRRGPRPAGPNPRTRHARRGQRPHRGDRPGAAAAGFGFEHHYIVPGFVDVHVHGVEGIDTLDPEESVGGLEAVRAIAARLPRYGVVAFCPTTVACAPAALRSVLGQVRRAREAPGVRSARVLPAHLESNFINPEYRGAQPLSCLRVPAGGSGRSGGSGGSGGSVGEEDDAGSRLRTSCR